MTGAPSTEERATIGATVRCADSSNAGDNVDSGMCDAVLGRRDEVCGAVVGLPADSSVGCADGGESSLPILSSVLERRLVTLSQLTGRTRVLACVRGVGGVVAPSGSADRWGSLEEKAALSLLNRGKDFLLSWTEVIRPLVLSSCSRCFFCLFCLSWSSLFLLSSSFLLRSSSFLRCLSRSLGAVLGLRSWGIKPEGYETMCIEWGRRWRGPMCGAGRLGSAAATRRVRRSAVLRGV